MRPRVKICGVTSAQEATLAVDLGADLIGLNFYPPSPRYLEPQRAAEIAAAVRGRVDLVGVFVDAPRRRLEEIADRVGLDLLQFHGDETPADLAPFRQRALKAFRVRDRLDPQLLAGYDGVWGVLVDSRHPRLYGGTGESWSFDSLPELISALPRRTFIAGGLGPGNVGAAIRAARPYGIDLCSGVEEKPGRKSSELLRRLFEEIEEQDTLQEESDGETTTAA